MNYLEKYPEIQYSDPTSRDHGIPALERVAKADPYTQFSICREAMQKCNCEIADRLNLPTSNFTEYKDAARILGQWVERRDFWKAAGNNIGTVTGRKQLEAIEARGAELLAEYPEDKFWSAPYFMVVDAHPYSRHPENKGVMQRPALTKKSTGSGGYYGSNRETELVFDSGFHSRQPLTWKTVKGALNNAVKMTRHPRGNIEVIACGNQFWHEDAKRSDDEQTELRRTALFGRRIVGELHRYPVL